MGPLRLKPMKSYREARADFERSYLRELMTEANGSVAQAALIAELNRTALYAVLHRAGVPRNYSNPRLNRGNAAWQSLGN